MTANQTTGPTGPYYDAGDAAAYIRHAPQTLANWRYRRSHGEDVGPDFFMRGRKPFYMRDALDAFMLGAAQPAAA